MFNVAAVVFVQQTGTRPGERTYEYRIPAHLDGAVKEGGLIVVSNKNDQSINPGLAKVMAVRNVLDGTYTGTDFAYVVDVVNTDKHTAMVDAEKRRARLLQLIEAERAKATARLDFDALAALSPELHKLVGALYELDGVTKTDTPAEATPATPATGEVQGVSQEELDRREALSRRLDGPGGYLAPR